jgi:hypothetical protein
MSWGTITPSNLVTLIRKNARTTIYLILKTSHDWQTLCESFGDGNMSESEKPVICTSTPRWKTCLYGGVFSGGFQLCCQDNGGCKFKLIKSPKPSHNKRYAKCSSHLIEYFRWNSHKISESEITEILKEHFA